MNFSQAEMVDMIYVLGASDKNLLLATRIYHQRYPQRRQPSVRTFRKVMDRFDNSGTVDYCKHVRKKRTFTEENELNVLLAVTEDPHISQREIGLQMDIGRTSVQRILKDNKMHPYHVQLLQELSDEDCRRRLEFCEWVQNKLRIERDFADFVLFGDEATFHKNGNVNRHNFHFFATENPHFVRMHSQNRWSLNVWGGIVGQYVIGPHFFEGRVTGEIYLDFLQNHLPQLLAHVPNEIKERMWFLHDGAPVHFTRPITNFLNETYGQRWIGRGGPVPWPARSPDLTKMDYGIWGFVKDNVYRTSPTTKDDMKMRIRNCFQSITVEMCRNLSTSFENRSDLCFQFNGRHFEHLVR